MAVAGEAHGVFTEEMFDEGQRLPSPYHRTKFEAEKAVRQAATVPWRVYRPSIVLGDSHTGEMDKIDGPYYFFPTIAWVAELPSAKRVPLVLPPLGDSNAVPVDYVADALDAAHAVPDGGRPPVSIPFDVAPEDSPSRPSFY